MQNNENNVAKLDNNDSSQSEKIENESQYFSFQFKKDLVKSHNNNNNANNDITPDYSDTSPSETSESNNSETRNLIFKHSQPFSFELIDKKIEHDTQRHYKNYDILDVVEDLSNNSSNTDYSHYSQLKSSQKENARFDNNEYEKEEINEFEEDEDTEQIINQDSFSNNKLDKLTQFTEEHTVHSIGKALDKQQDKPHIFSSLELNPITTAAEDTTMQHYLKKSYLHLKDIAIGTSILSITSIACAFLIGMFTFSSSHYQAEPNFEPIVQVQPPIVQNNGMNNIRANPFNNLAYTRSQVSHFDSLSMDNQVNLLNSLINFKQYQTFNQLVDKQKISPSVLSEILGTYNSIFTSDPEYFNAFQKILAAGADWKQDQFLFLKQTASSKDWRHYWISYFNKNQPDMLPVYAYIIKEALGPEADPVLNSVN